jgi:polar amino acid transport system permease protein
MGTAGKIEEATGDRGRPDDIKAVPVRHPGRWIGGVLTAVIAASLINSFISSKGAEWNVVGNFLFDQRIINGAGVTLELTVISMVIGVGLGVLLAVMRQSPNPVFKSVSWAYIWLFRGTPVLVQLVFWFNIAALYPKLTFGIPFGGPVLVTGNANTLISAMTAAILGLGLNEGAYMAEIVRAGLLSVDEGQAEAAEALGLSRTQTLRHIVLPQAMRVIVPPTGNETISMLKTTSLVVVLGSVFDLFTSGSLIYAQNYKTIALLIVISIWYLAMTSVLYVGQYYLERRFGRGSTRNLPPTPRERLVSLWRKWRPDQAESAA